VLANPNLHVDVLLMSSASGEKNGFRLVLFESDGILFRPRQSLCSALVETVSDAGYVRALYNLCDVVHERESNSRIHLLFYHGSQVRYID
jgi:hypothetical protein